MSCCTTNTDFLARSSLSRTGYHHFAKSWSLVQHSRIKEKHESSVNADYCHTWLAFMHLHARPRFVTWSTIQVIGTGGLFMFLTILKWTGWGFSWFVTKDLVIMIMANSTFPSPLKSKIEKTYWYFLYFTRLHRTTVLKLKFIVNSILERAWNLLKLSKMVAMCM